jgi:hypothetical protein
MADVYTLGLAKIEIGDIANDGGMGTSLDVLGQTLQGTCNISQDDPETTEFFAEELDDPVVSISKRGKTTLTFSIMNPDVQVLQKALGGTVSGSGDAAKWSSPTQIPIIEKSVKVTPQQGLIFEFPRVKIVAKINGAFSRDNIFVIEVTGTALQPTKSGTAPFTAYKITSA